VVHQPFPLVNSIHEKIQKIAAEKKARKLRQAKISETRVSYT
jgi:hypothetical protein